jgi:hypothetical protein
MSLFIQPPPPGETVDHSQPNPKDLSFYMIPLALKSESTRDTFPFLVGVLVLGDSATVNGVKDHPVIQKNCVLIIEKQGEQENIVAVHEHVPSIGCYNCKAGDLLFAVIAPGLKLHTEDGTIYPHDPYLVYRRPTEAEKETVQEEEQKM